MTFLRSQQIYEVAKIMSVIPDKERLKSLYVGPRCLKPLFRTKSVSQGRWDMLQELAIVSNTTFYDPILLYIQRPHFPSRPTFPLQTHSQSPQLRLNGLPYRALGTACVSTYGWHLFSTPRLPRYIS